MNDQWVVKLARANEAVRWNTAEKIRVARLFRHHVRTPSNPLGRIHKEKCWYCVQRARKTGSPRLEHIFEADGSHHPDYKRPFAVVWVCNSHHRQIDHGSLRVTKRAIHDYTSLVAAVERPGGRLEARERNKQAIADMVDDMTGGEDDCPF